MMTIPGCDNQATILWETEGVSSQTKHSKHINVQFFFVKDHVDCREVSIEYVNTYKMWTNFFIKPSQGPNFIHFGKLALNLED